MLKHHFFLPSRLTVRPGTLPELFPGPPLVLNFVSSPFRTLYLCFTMGVAIATRQVLGTPAEQERHAYAVPFFPLGSGFLPIEKSVLWLERRPLSHKYCFRFGVDLRFDTHLGYELHKFAQIYIFSQWGVKPLFDPRLCKAFCFPPPPPRVSGIGSSVICLARLDFV